MAQGRRGPRAGIACALFPGAHPLFGWRGLLTVGLRRHVSTFRELEEKRPTTRSRPDEVDWALVAFGRAIRTTGRDAMRARELTVRALGNLSLGEYHALPLCFRNA